MYAEAGQASLASEGGSVLPGKPNVGSSPAAAATKLDQGDKPVLRLHQEHESNQCQKPLLKKRASPKKDQDGDTDMAEEGEEEEGAKGKEEDYEGEKQRVLTSTVLQTGATLPGKKHNQRAAAGGPAGSGHSRELSGGDAALGADDALNRSGMQVEDEDHFGRGSSGMNGAVGV